MTAMEKNNKTLNVPHLRFPEFSGEWEKYSLNDISTIYGRIGFRGYTVADIVEKGEGAIALSPTNIDSNCLTYEKDNTYISTYKYEESPEIKIFAGDIIFVKTGSTVGKVAFVDNIIDRTTLNPQLVVLKQVKCNPYFLYLLMAAPCFQKHIKRITVGGAVPTLSQNEMGRIGITLPPNAEQDRISALFKLLNYRIETQKKIIEKYESLIRGLCEKLTRQGATNKTIAECLECHSSTLQESAVLDAGSYPVYGAIGICGHADTPDVSGDGILIIKDGASVGVTYFANGSYSFIGTLNRLTAKEDINLRYVYYCLKVLNFTPYKTGLAIPHIYLKDYGKHKIWCPTHEQQSRIADALTTIDDKIQVEKSLLEQLNSQKRYMLNQLFI